MPIITRSLNSRFAPKGPAPAQADADARPAKRKRTKPPAKKFDESTSRGLLDRIAHQLDECSAFALNPDTSQFDLPTIEHNLDCLICEIDDTELDETVEWEEVKEMKKKIRKVISDMAPRLWGNGR